MKKIIKHSVILIFIITLLSCSKSDDSSSSSLSFTALIDGENFEAREDLIFALEINKVYLSVGGTNDNFKNTKTIDFTIDASITNVIETGTVMTDSNQNFDVLANYVDFDEDINAWSDETGGSYYIKITKIDYEKELVSGEFKFTLVDDDLNESFEITDGVFKNVPF
ncbi:MAG: hypothetical protein COA50_16035 [Flavobacteriaceae bacterium]|nr:MAG: hypothetical protein COA50_16035 [Flavobacteriaceae bacterium]